VLRMVQSPLFEGVTKVTSFKAKLGKGVNNYYNPSRGRRTTRRETKVFGGGIER